MEIDMFEIILQLSFRYVLPMQHSISIKDMKTYVKDIGRNGLTMKSIHKKLTFPNTFQ